MRHFPLLAVGLLLVVGCSRPSDPASPLPPGMVLMLQTDGNVLVDDQHSISIAELPDVLMRAMQRLEANGGFAGETVVTITCDGAATYGDLKQLLTQCARCQIETFVLKFDRDFPFTLPLAVLAVESERIPPLIVYLSADADGSLAEIRFINRLFSSLDELHRQAISVIGDDRGPGSLSDSLELEFRADDGLLLANLGDAYQSVAGYTAPDGEFIPLFTRISPIRKFFPRPRINDYIQEDTEFILDEVEPDGQRPSPIELEVELLP